MTLQKVDTSLVLVFGVSVLLFAAGFGGAQMLSASFYDSSCPMMKSIVAATVAQHLLQDITSAAPLLRIFFHDCFVSGCDASVLLDSTNGNSAEKDAQPNQTLSQFNIIDEIKNQLEKLCPGVVSCADIIALASREAVAQSGGPRWMAEMGRRDGRKSSALDASLHLPSTRSSAQPLIDSFAALGLNTRDLVTLSGAHTFGRAHCFAVARRFIGFNSSNGIDPTLDTVYAQRLRRLCPLPIDPRARVALDPVTPNQFDTEYFQDLLVNQGIFSSDSALVLDSRTKNFVNEYATNTSSFFVQFPLAMTKLGRIGVLTGQSGEIRKTCHAVNSF
ncbi:hypothetical protein O6H91_01G027100 [Diphasiastrum complanatum]|uniref:Uncharacterized protein n=1 Tax=Diphasiastrum complanatum TaxID=34168 RepID=A0ACC2EPA4_DIPCM|nr:hypothetical protein O6H91_01G027100 [Diphasiastrum complanatum]